ncbi:hypothetical protein PCS_02604 [Desulfocurvibacter africanus PCS]|uniref:Uncharacterized protein n=1 Tax=Desulfocurvibacter africanus PCS TaxID=1262666 RepID=M5PQH8_DESAF|nr:hypothetical protein PCS_02604 [Desulfocurvibacter africanus PCS]
MFPLRHNLTSCGVVRSWIKRSDPETYTEVPCLGCPLRVEYREVLAKRAESRQALGGGSGLGRAERDGQAHSG